MRILFTIPFLALAAIFSAPTARAHPIPDIPVRSHFDSGGTCRIEVEVDIRCFTEDPLNEPYLLKWVLDEMDSAERDELKAKAARLVREGVAFRFEQTGPASPEFDFAFTTKDAQTLANIDDPVMLTGTWHTSVPGGASAYQIEAPASARYDLRFLNWLKGQPVERTQVLFPEEKSYLLDLSIIAPAAPVPLGTFAHYLPFMIITAAVTGAVAGLRWARRNRVL